MKYLFITCIIVFTSCQNRERTYVLDMVKEWEGKEIKFPESSMFTKYMCDTVLCDMDLDFKLMVYIDSTGCTSCKLQLNKWKDYLHELDSITNHRVAPLFYVCPKNKVEFGHILKHDKFSFPICVDEYDSLNIINKFSKDPKFQVFLLKKVREKFN